ncbi:MAG: NAD(P)-binding domain-containing protein [Granulosicoccus sp.]
MSGLTSGVKVSSLDDIGLTALEQQLRTDLECLCCPPTNWVPAMQAKHSAQTDVLIVGGGMCGLLVWFALRCAGIHNVRIIDKNAFGQEGPWVSYARMQTLRSPKHLTGPAYGIGALTFQAWYRAQFGVENWDALDKIPRTMWMDYLRWYRQALEIPVENNIALTRVASSDGLLTLTLEGSAQETVTARKLIYATGRDGIARANIPDFIKGLDSESWAHSSHDIDFDALRGKRVVVVGVGASAVDNAAEALEAGAAEVRHLIRRRHMPTINKMMGIGSFGFMAGFADLPDEWRWRFMHYSFATQTPSPRGSTLRVSQHDNAYFHFNKSIDSVCSAHGADEGLDIRFTDGTHLSTDYIILGTGFSTDPMARSELGEAASRILLWEDVYRPPIDEQNEDLGRFPYLAADFSFREKHESDASWLQHVHCFNYGATASLGKVSGDIPGISEGARWLAKALASRLYQEDIDVHWQGMQDYVKPELQGDEWEASELPESSHVRKVV